jgi:predicted lipoprotein with Yx(FWY)xxD motif
METPVIRQERHMRITTNVRAHTHLGRWVALGAAALFAAGAATASASSPPSEPATGTAGPSNCPAVTEESETASSQAPTGSEAAAATEPVASTAPAATEATASTAPEASEAAAGPFVQVVETDEYGTVLVDSACRALYMFESDSDGEPTCFDDCAAAWPPLFVSDDTMPAVADELDPSLFSVVQHPDGPMLKYGDWPLYYFIQDTGPGQFNGQGVDAFGGLWWLVGPDGTPVKTEEEGEATATTTADVDTTY